MARRFHEVAVEREHLHITGYPLRWWPVKAFLHIVHVVTFCRGCWWGPLYSLDMKRLNTPSRESFRIPIGPDVAVRLAESYGFTLADEVDLDG